jgi:hypothetical protein
MNSPAFTVFRRRDGAFDAKMAFSHAMRTKNLGWIIVVCYPEG